MTDPSMKEEKTIQEVRPEGHSSGDSSQDPKDFGNKRKRKDRFPDRQSIEEHWRKKKQEKKVRDAERRTAKTEEDKQAWQTLTEEERQAKREAAVTVHNLRRQKEQKENELCLSNLSSDAVPTILFDCSFERIMSETDLRSTMQQLKYSYSMLKRHKFCLKPFYCGWGDPMIPIGAMSKEQAALLDSPPPPATAASGEEGADVSGSSTCNSFRCGAEMVGWEGFRRYPPQFDPRHWSTVAKERDVASKLVYLTADSEVVLNELQPDEIYIVGCFVDHNSKKGLTLDVAQEYGVRTARLPLQETLVKMGNTCKVLTINHVTELLAVFQSTKSWEEACKVLPTRRADEGGNQKKKEATSSGKMEEGPSAAEKES